MALLAVPAAAVTRPDSGVGAGVGVGVGVVVPVLSSSVTVMVVTWSCGLRVVDAVTQVNPWTPPITVPIFEPGAQRVCHVLQDGRELQGRVGYYEWRVGKGSLGAQSVALGRKLTL